MPCHDMMSMLGESWFSFSVGKGIDASVSMDGGYPNSKHLAVTDAILGIDKVNASHL